MLETDDVLSSRNTLLNEQKSRSAKITRRSGVSRPSADVPGCTTTVMPVGGADLSLEVNQDRG